VDNTQNGSAQSGVGKSEVVDDPSLKLLPPREPLDANKENSEPNESSPNNERSHLSLTQR
jgi:hypothetical protein